MRWRSVVAVSVAVVGAGPRCAAGLDNGVVQLPPLGWNSWCSFGPCGTDVCTHDQVNATLTAIAQNGMRDLGYNYFTLDDCFAMRRDSNGTLYPDTTLFPHGFEPLVLRAHSLGLKFGVYTSAGNFTCHAKKDSCNDTCNVGSLGHYTDDAATFAGWGLDFVKMDWCSASVAHLSCETQYGEMSQALNRTGRPIAFYMSCGGGGRAKSWSKDVANVWRIGNDHLDCWDDGPCPRAVNYTSSGHGTKQAIGYLTGISGYSGPGGFGTPDFLKTGGESCSVKAVPGDLCPKQTLTEYQTEYTMWAMASAPLLVSTDIRQLTPIQRAVLLNPEVIAIDQQPTAVSGAGVQSPPAPGTWFVVKNADALPDRPHEECGRFHNASFTPDGASCQQLCSANASCTIYEWSAKSSTCWFRLDGDWTQLRSVDLRESGCLVGKVATCGVGPVPPPPPPPPPPNRGDCQIWAKPLVETTYPGTRGWSALESHRAVALLNLGDAAAVIAVNVSQVVPGATKVRNVWGNDTGVVPVGGIYRAQVPAHGTLLLRVWHDSG